MTSVFRRASIWCQLKLGIETHQCLRLEHQNNAGVIQINKDSIQTIPNQSYGAQLHREQGKVGLPNRHPGIGHFTRCTVTAWPTSSARASEYSEAERQSAFDQQMSSEHRPHQWAICE